MTIGVGPGTTELVLESHWYLEYHTNYGGKQGCLLQFKQLTSSEQLYWVMGTSFLRAYTTIYNSHVNQIGFYKNIDEIFEQIKRDAMVLLIVFGVLFLLCVICAVIGVVICCIYSKNKEEQIKRQRKDKYSTTQEIVEV